MTKLGIELEYPLAGDRPMQDRARGSRDLYHAVRNDESRDPFYATDTRDSTVGLETVSDVIDLWDGQEWLERNVALLEHEYNAPYGPCGLHGRGGSAGLHLHLSPLTSEQARALYELSTDPYVRGLVCTSPVADHAPYYQLHRHRYVSFRGFDSGRSCVNHRGRGHYEWRLPEPMLPEHFHNVCRFIELITQDEYDEAQAYAQACVEAGDTTAMARIDAIGTPPAGRLSPRERVYAEPPPDVPMTDDVTCAWYRCNRHDDTTPYMVDTDGGWLLAIMSPRFTASDPRSFPTPNGSVQVYDGSVLSVPSLSPIDGIERRASVVTDVRDVHREVSDVPTAAKRGTAERCAALGAF